VTDRDHRHRRPLLLADVVALIDDAGAGDPYARLELAHATAGAVVAAGRDGEDTCEGMVQLADTVGLDTLAELWRAAAADSLPGALWSLYLLRTWCTRQASEVARLYRSGRALAPVDEVVAGVADAGGPAEIQAVADAVLAGLYDGDLAVALERAAAFFRVVAAGRDWHATEGPPGDRDRERAIRNREAAAALGRAADAWRAGRLR